LLLKRPFPFDEYVVEYENEDINDHDITATAVQSGKLLIGEAFNIAPSFFQGKKTSMLKKLRSTGESADYKIIVANADLDISLAMNLTPFPFDTSIPGSSPSVPLLIVNSKSEILFPGS